MKVHTVSAGSLCCANECPVLDTPIRERPAVRQVVLFVVVRILRGCELASDQSRMMSSRMMMMRPAVEM